MTLRQLEYLVALADTLHFHRAAQRVHATQPTVSNQLQALERSLGVHLIERTHSKVTMTRIGLEVAEIARCVMREVHRINDLTIKKRPIVHLGIIRTIGPWLLPRIIPKLKTRHPHLMLSVREELHDELYCGLTDGFHDAIITPVPAKSQGLQRTLIFEEPLYLVVSIYHKLGTLNTIELQDLYDVDLLALGEGYELHDTVMSFASKAGAKVQFDYAETSIDTLSAMVATNAGASILPGLYVHDVIRHDSRLRTFEISHLCPPRPITMSWRKEIAGQEHLERLATLIRAAIPSDFRTQASAVAINGSLPVR